MGWHGVFAPPLPHDYDRQRKVSLTHTHTHTCPQAVPCHSNLEQERRGEPYDIIWHPMTRAGARHDPIETIRATPYDTLWRPMTAYDTL